MFYPTVDVYVFDVVSNVNINVAILVFALPVGTEFAALKEYCAAIVPPLSKLYSFRFYFQLK